MALIQTYLQQCPAAVSTGFTQFRSSPSSHYSTRVSIKFTVSCCSMSSPVTVVNGNVDVKSTERNEIRLGLPSKGRMASDTLDLLKVYFLSVSLETMN